MKNSQTLRKAAEWMYDNGFSPEYMRWNSSCGCFIRAKSAAALNVPLFNRNGDETGISQILRPIIGADCALEEDLVRKGWTGPEVTEDAVAALLIAADIEEAEGR